MNKCYDEKQFLNKTCGGGTLMECTRALLAAVVAQVSAYIGMVAGAMQFVKYDEAKACQRLRTAARA